MSVLKFYKFGTGGLVGKFRPIIEALTAKFGLSAYVIDPYFGQTSATELLESVSSLQFVGYVMLVGFMWNIFLVAFRKHTKIRTLFITGHIMYQQSAVLLWAMYWVIEGAAGVPVTMPLVIACGFFIGTYWSVMSNLIIEATQEVTDGAGFTVGHQQMFGSWVAYKLAGKIGNKEHSVDNVEVPGWLSIFNDNIVSTLYL